MPTPTTSSPIKRPGLGRRAISSHAVVTRTSSSQELSDSQNQKALVHRPRAHVVGGHRNHGRNPSFGKNLNKLQRHTSAQHISTETPARSHQRKKSAPVTPAASPREKHHVRWDDTGADSTHTSTTSMKRNNSSPALQNIRRHSSGALVKKALVTDRPPSSSGKKKTVGFELGDSDPDDAEWEDTTQSPESTRRNSVAHSAKESVENPAVLVDPLTFVKRPTPRFPRAASLPESAHRSFSQEDQFPDEDEDEDEEADQQQQQEQEQLSSDTEEQQEEADRVPDYVDITSRLLSASHSAKAPPAMSSISATAIPAPVDSISRNASLTNLASAHDGLRRPLSSSNITLGNTPGNHTQATSSSIEGGVSRFIINSEEGEHAFSRTDSDPNTPSSFLPHYHPQTPPSPHRGTRKTQASPPSRPPGAEPPSRTQQKLWLQRTAALNTSPPDAHGAPATGSPSTMDLTFMAATHVRPGSGAYDAGRALVNGTPRTGGDSEAKHIRKAYEKAALELTVVRRFQSPTADSFRRLNASLNYSKGPGSRHDQNPPLGKSIKSAPTLTFLQDERQKKPGQDTSGPEPRQLISRRTSGLKTSASQVYLQEPDDPSDSADTRHKSQHPSHQILSTSDEVVHSDPPTEEDFGDNYSSNESEMMIRRMWESREIATSS